MADWNVSTAYVPPASSDSSQTETRQPDVSSSPSSQQIDLLPGDIIVQGKGHSLMWVGSDDGVDNKELVHNVDQGKFHGVMRQDGAKIPEGADVFRCDDPELAKLAAKYAISWSTESGTPEMAEALKEKGGRLKSPYSHDRMVHAEYEITDDKEREWTIASLFRALKATARKEHLTPKKGSSCSQFVTYCFQAAAIERALGDQRTIPNDLMQMIATAGAFNKLQDRKEAGERNIIQRLNDILPLTDTLRIPPAVLVDAKSVYVGFLRKNLEKDDSGFKRTGNVAVGNSKPKIQTG